MRAKQVLPPCGQHEPLTPIPKENPFTNHVLRPRHPSSVKRTHVCCSVSSPPLNQAIIHPRTFNGFNNMITDLCGQTNHQNTRGPQVNVRAPAHRAMQHGLDQERALDHCSDVHQNPTFEVNQPDDRDNDRVSIGRWTRNHQQHHKSHYSIRKKVL